MKNEYDNLAKVRQALEQGSLSIDSSVARRLQQYRNNALDRQKVAAVELNLATSVANFGLQIGNRFLPNIRALTALMALTIGVVGTYYWNALEQADENEAVDSALLADDLPVDAFTDQGFEAWLEHSLHSSPQ